MMNISSATQIKPISQSYLFLGYCFSYPTEEFYKTVGRKEWADEWSVLIASLPFKVDIKGIPSPTLQQDEFESEYINNFDITPSCPLYESSYPRKEMSSRDIYEDLFRFYEHFNVRLNEKEKDYPDNLVAELEFMSFLVKKEYDVLELGKNPEPYRRAQLDFLKRHLNQWVTKLDERILKSLKEPFYIGASAFMVKFLRNHQLCLQEMLKSRLKRN